MFYISFVMAVILMLPGLIGVFLPIVPGIPYMLVIALAYGFLDRFQHLSFEELVLLAVIALFSIAVDYLAGVIGAKKAGALKTSLAYGVIGLLLGMIFLPPFGGFIGLFFGILLAEYAQHSDGKRALKVSYASVLGMITGMAVNLALGLIFIGVFIYSVVN